MINLLSCSVSEPVKAIQSSLLKKIIIKKDVSTVETLIINLKNAFLSPDPVDEVQHANKQ